MPNPPIVSPSTTHPHYPACDLPKNAKARAAIPAKLRFGGLTPVIFPSANQPSFISPFTWIPADLDGFACSEWKQSDQQVQYLAATVDHTTLEGLPRGINLRWRRQEGAEGPLRLGGMDYEYHRLLRIFPGPFLCREVTWRSTFLNAPFWTGIKDDFGSLEPLSQAGGNGSLFHQYCRKLIKLYTIKRSSS